jgi:hypothetical protein
MNKIFYKLLLSLFIFLLGVSTSHALTQVDACNILLKAAVKKHFAANESPNRYYDCVSDGWKHKHYFVFDLHYRSKIPTGNNGSNLVGWYAVDKITGQLFGWNIANLKLGDVIYIKK